MTSMPTPGVPADETGRHRAEPVTMPNDLRHPDTLSAEERLTLDRLRFEAQTIFNAHPLSGQSGSCITCGYAECEPRRSAMRTLNAYMWLPTRTPGATQPELIGAKKIA